MTNTKRQHRGFWKQKKFNLEQSHVLIIKAIRGKINARSDSAALRYILNKVSQSLTGKKSKCAKCGHES